MRFSAGNMHTRATIATPMMLMCVAFSNVDILTPPFPAVQRERALFHLQRTGNAAQSPSVTVVSRSTLANHIRHAPIAVGGLLRAATV